MKPIIFVDVMVLISAVGAPTVLVPDEEDYNYKLCNHLMQI